MFIFGKFFYVFYCDLDLVFVVLFLPNFGFIVIVLKWNFTIMCGIIIVIYILVNLVVVKSFVSKIQKEHVPVGNF